MIHPYTVGNAMKAITNALEAIQHETINTDSIITNTWCCDDAFKNNNAHTSSHMLYTVKESCNVEDSYKFSYVTLPRSHKLSMDPVILSMIHTWSAEYMGVYAHILIRQVNDLRITAKNIYKGI